MAGSLAATPGKFNAKAQRPKAAKQTYFLNPCALVALRLCVNSYSTTAASVKRPTSFSPG
jgi:hypothetical protein